MLEAETVFLTMPMFLASSCGIVHIKPDLAKFFL
jgi:hypothetical protein